MTSRRIRVLVPPPLAVPRAAVWIGLLLDWVASRATQATRPAAAPRYATEGGK